MDLTGNRLKLQTEKRSEKRFSTMQKKIVEFKDSESIRLTFLLQIVRIKLNKTWKKRIEIGTVVNIQNWN